LTTLKDEEQNNRSIDFLRYQRTSSTKSVVVGCDGSINVNGVRKRTVISLMASSSCYTQKRTGFSLVDFPEMFT
jgi:hypothetical protein